MKDDSKQKQFADKQDAQKSRGEPFVPPDVIPDTLQVPPETIMVIPDHEAFTDPTHFVKCSKNRDWFTPPFYHCLPLVFGNQHGFLMLSVFDFVARWNGTNNNDGVSIHILDEVDARTPITVESHFGHGIITVQSRYVFRTPKGVNLMVKEPPNYPVRGCSWMNAVVETDNLRRDFTFNIRITEPHSDIYFAAGTPLGCLLPYPRYFLDNYKMAELKDKKELEKAQKTISYFATERGEYDNNNPRHRYMEGIDIFGLEFDEHQKSLDNGEWWRSRKGTPDQSAQQPPPKTKRSFWDWLKGS